MANRFNPVSSEQQNPLFLTYQNPQWSSNAISSENVLHYFCDQNNPFYDRTSDNEQLKMQNMGLQNLDSINQDLTRMNGIQYIVHSSCPPLYIICKQKRNSQTNVTPICYYYVLNGVIYQAPDLYSSVQSRLVGAVEPLKKALQQTLEMSRFNVTKGSYSWDFKTEPAKSSKKGRKPAADDDEEQESRLEEASKLRATPYQTTRTEMLLRLLHDQFPSDSQPSNIGTIPPEHRASSVVNGSIASGMTAQEASQRSITGSPAPFFQQSQSTHGQEAGSQPRHRSNLDLPPVLSTLPTGVSQMSNDVLTRLQDTCQEERRNTKEDSSKMIMEVDSTQTQ